MPDASDSNNDLAALFQQAEAEGQREIELHSQTPEQMNTNTCDHAGSDLQSRRWCRQCKQLICQFCWSVIDANYCKPCMQNVNVQVEQSTLVDDEGVTHHGRLLKPLGDINHLRWIPDGKTTAKALSEMSCSELEEYIEAYKAAVRDAEKALDIRRIRLSSGLLELDERHAQERRRLRADKTKYPIKTVSLDPKTGKQVKKTASAQQAMNMLDLLKAMQALKAKVIERSKNGGK